MARFARALIVICACSLLWEGRCNAVGIAQETYGPSGFGATVQASGSSTPGAQEANSVTPAPGYTGATVVSDTFGGTAIWLGTGQGPGQQLGCASGQATIADSTGAPAGSVIYVLVNQQGDPLGTDAVSCTAGPGGGVPGPPPPPPTGAQVWAAEAQTWQNLVSTGLRVNPSSLGLTGLASWFWLTNRTTNLVAPAARVGGYTVTASAAIASYTWIFGDGASVVAYRPGDAHHPAVSHTYQTKGAYVVRVVGHYVGTFTFAGFGIPAQTMPFAIDVTMGSLSYRVQEVRSVLDSPGGGG